MAATTAPQDNLMTFCKDSSNFLKGFPIRSQRPLHTDERKKAKNQIEELREAVEIYEEDQGRGNRDRVQNCLGKLVNIFRNLWNYVKGDPELPDEVKERVLKPQARFYPILQRLEDFEEHPETWQHTKTEVGR